jgi:hypothetical protein
MPVSTHEIPQDHLLKPISKILAAARLKLMAHFRHVWASQSWIMRFFNGLILPPANNNSHSRLKSNMEQKPATSRTREVISKPTSSFSGDWSGI